MLFVLGLVGCDTSAPDEDENSSPNQVEKRLGEQAEPEPIQDDEPFDSVKIVKDALRAESKAADVVAVVKVLGREVLPPAIKGDYAHTVYELSSTGTVHGASFSTCKLTVPGGIIEGVEMTTSEYIELPNGGEYIAFLRFGKDKTCQRSGPMQPLGEGVAQFGSEVSLTPAELSELLNK